MKLRHLFSLGLFFTGISCSMQIRSTEIESTSEDQTTSGPIAYPGVSDVEDSEEIPSNDPWRCGSEWIVVDGPGGEKIYSELPLLCDPLADVYLGCPPDLSNASEK